MTLKTFLPSKQVVVLIWFFSSFWKKIIVELPKIASNYKLIQNVWLFTQTKKIFFHFQSIQHQWVNLRLPKYFAPLRFIAVFKVHNFNSLSQLKKLMFVLSKDLSVIICIKPLRIRHSAKFLFIIRSSAKKIAKQRSYCVLSEKEWNLQWCVCGVGAKS